MKKKTSVMVDDQLWKDVKIHCIGINKDISDYLEEVLKKDLHKKNKKPATPVSS